MTAPFPAGVPVVLDRSTRVLDGGRVLLGGDPGRLVRLRDSAVVGRLSRAPRERSPGEELPGEGAPGERSLRLLARTLVDGGLAHPCPGRAPVRDLVVVVPVRDRTEELARCLQALGTTVPVVVVDDGSQDPGAVARVAEAHGARVVHQPGSGPAGARNTGVAATTESLVAFVDSDVAVPRDWLAGLVGHFADPCAGAVAPRVRATAGGRGLLARYAAARGPLDLGDRQAGVRPGGRVPYVPSAALVVRRSALTDVGRGAAAPFDPALRYGEDVDLVWRLHDAGWAVRYDPRTVVGHAEPARWIPWLRRRHAYGTSAAPLALRHDAGRLTPLVLPPWPTAAWLLLAARRPLPALAAAAVPTVRLHRRLRRSGLGHRTSGSVAVAATGRAVLGTAGGLGGAGTVVVAPALLGLLAARRTRAAALVLLLAPPLLEHRVRRPAVDPVRWTALRLVDDLAYATGVWRGCWTGRTAAALRPRRTRPA